MLLASNARFDLRLSRKPASVNVSFGDSYALGIAGTGGTYSSSSWLDELWVESGFGAGNRKLAICELRCWADAVDVRTVVLRLALEATERPELYDLRFKSGVVREEQGVEILRGSMEGERDAERTSADNGGGFGRPGAGAGLWEWCNDSRFIRLVSVGLMVLAPRPVACGSWGTPGITDTRFPATWFEPLAAPLGDRGNAIDMWLWSSDRALVSGDNMAWLALAGGCTDRALALRELA